jgi:CMP-N-acetylneuraminic acid synthetase
VKICVIPARCGSVRIPGKNIRAFHGKPIIAYSIECARDTGVFDRVIVSTDDVATADVARSFGAEPMMRPPGWDDIGTQEVGARVAEAVATREMIPLYVCVLYATCPLLRPSDLMDGLLLMRTTEATFAFAVGREPLRDAGAFYWGRGWAYIAREPLIGTRTALVPLPEDRVCDINTESDWQRAERMYAALIATNA